MKSLSWTDFNASRFLEWMTRGEVPVDGVLDVGQCAAESRRADLERSTRECEDAGLIARAPVRWGNYR